MLSRQTTTIPSAIRSQKMLFIIIQNMAGLLVIPKNITNSSNSLWLVWNMVFHLSLDLICTLLKPQQILSLVKSLAPQSYKISLEIRKKGYLFLIVMALRDQQSWTRQSKPFFFLIKKTGVAIENLKGQIHLVCKFSLRKVFML